MDPNNPHDPYAPPATSDLVPTDADERISAQPGSQIDFGRCFTFVFEDPRWPSKILIGSLFALLSMFVVGTFFLVGHSLAVIRNVSRGKRHPLPEWNDLGAFFVEGLLATLVYLAYTLVAMVPFFPPFVATIFFTGQEGELSGVAAFVFFGFMMIGFVILFAVLLYVPAAIARYAVEQRLGAAFELGQNLAFIRRNALNYALAILLLFIVQFAAQFGVLLLCIGILPASVWATWAFAYAMGEVALRDRGKATATP